MVCTHAGATIIMSLKWCAHMQEQPSPCPLLCLPFSNQHIMPQTLFSFFETAHHVPLLFPPFSEQHTMSLALFSFLKTAHSQVLPVPWSRSVAISAPCQRLHPGQANVKLV
eukprot:1139249-Pelagomonas_calceolata.AAC.9